MGTDRALHELYRLQDELTAVARAAGIEDLDIRVDEAQRVVVVDARTTPIEVDDALRSFADSRVEIRRERSGDRTRGGVERRGVLGGTEQRVRLHVGPLPSDVTREWIADRRLFVDRARSTSVLSLDHDALELLDTYLDIWERESRQSDVFDWTYDLHVDIFLHIATHWLALAEVSPEQRAEMGVPSVGPHAPVVNDAVVRGVVEALESLGGRGQALLDRLT